MTDKRILVVDDDAYVREATEEILLRRKYKVETASDGKAALAKLDEADFDLILSDIKMPVMNGLELLEAARLKAPDTHVIMMTAFGTIEDAVEAMKKGAYDYVQKGSADPAEIEFVVERALKFQDAQLENKRLRSELKEKYSYGNMVGKAHNMEQVFDLIGTVADSRATVLITGESGTGKELVARALHYNSSRSTSPFIRVNCAALPKDLMESELFGHEKGAFTGATDKKAGKFELADNGTLFLDEIGEMSPTIQAKFLRVLEGHAFERVGGSTRLKVDVRVVAATNRHLEDAVASGGFRRDLYFRLRVVEIAVPPLRKRQEDIELLANHFVDVFSRETGRKIEGFSSAAIGAMQEYHWPGNIRELGNIVERSCLMCRGDTMLPTHLFFDEELYSKDKVLPRLSGTIYEMEKELIMQTLEEVNGNKTKAADSLGISIRTLRNKLNEYGE